MTDKKLLDGFREELNDLVAELEEELDLEIVKLRGVQTQFNKCKDFFNKREMTGDDVFFRELRNILTED